MEYRELGKTGLKISRLGFGGIPIQRIDAEGTRKLVLEMLEAGVNYIDTARGYTVSEEYLGYALEGIRDKFILASKCMCWDKESMAKNIETSLKNLRTDYIDLYQLHNPNMAQLEQSMAPGGALEALLEAKAAGKIGHIGLTNHSLEVFKKALEYDWMETFMFPYNIVETQGEATMAKSAQKGIGFICMKPLAGGAIEDPTLALRWICANDDVHVVIPGMADPAELQQNVAAVSNTAPLSPEETAKAMEIRSALGNNFCRRCNYCQPCSAGINISGCFTFDSYYSRYGLAGWAAERYGVMPKHASDCVGCGACEDRCPYHLPIREMLKNVASHFGY